MTDHRAEYFKILNEKQDVFEQGDIGQLIDAVFLLNMHISRMPASENPEGDAWMYSNFAHICADALGDIYAANAEERLKKKVRKIDKWANDFNKKALQVFPLSLYAQRNALTWAAGALSANGMSFMDIVKTARQQGNSNKRAESFTYNLTSSGISKSKFKKALSKYLEMFVEYFSVLRAIDIFIDESEFLLFMADFAEETGQGSPEKILATIMTVSEGASNGKLSFYDGTEEDEMERMGNVFLEIVEKAQARLAAL